MLANIAADSVDYKGEKVKDNFILSLLDINDEISRVLASQITQLYCISIDTSTHIDDRWIYPLVENFS
jgi:hypothetical protein